MRGGSRKHAGARGAEGPKRVGMCTVRLQAGEGAPVALEKDSAAGTKVVRDPQDARPQSTRQRTTAKQTGRGSLHRCSRPSGVAERAKSLLGLPDSTPAPGGGPRRTPARSAPAAVPSHSAPPLPHGSPTPPFDPAPRAYGSPRETEAPSPLLLYSLLTRDLGKAVGREGSRRRTKHGGGGGGDEDSGGYGDGSGVEQVGGDYSVQLSGGKSQAAGSEGGDTAEQDS